MSGSDASLPTDLSGKDDSNIVPDKAFQFPTKAIGSKLRSCAHHWFLYYTWLEYSVERDAVFCKPCRHFSRPSKAGDHDGVFTAAGFSNWKKMNQKLEKHQGSNVHTDNVVKSMAYNTTKLVISGTISEQLASDTNIELRNLITGDQGHLELVIDLILFHFGRIFLYVDIMKDFQMRLQRVTVGTSLSSITFYQSRKVCI